MEMFQKVLPIIATVTAAYFTGGTSLAAEGAAAAGAEAAAGAASSAAAAAGTAAAGGSWLGSTIATVTPYLKGVALASQIGGTAMQALDARAAGKANQNAADMEAEQLRNNANSELGAASVNMQQQNRQTAYVLSNAQAAAAAGGGSATDPSVVTNMKTIAGEGRFRALTDLYNGESAAQSSRNRAVATQYSGNIARQAGDTKFNSTIVSGGSSLYDKYGDPDSRYGYGTPAFMRGA